MHKSVRAALGIVVLAMATDVYGQSLTAPNLETLQSGPPWNITSTCGNNGAGVITANGTAGQYICNPNITADTSAQSNYAPPGYTGFVATSALSFWNPATYSTNVVVGIQPNVGGFLVLQDIVGNDDIAMFGDPERGGSILMFDPSFDSNLVLSATASHGGAEILMQNNVNAPAGAYNGNTTVYLNADDGAGNAEVTLEDSNQDQNIQLFGGSGNIYGSGGLTMEGSIASTSLGDNPAPLCTGPGGVITHIGCTFSGGSSGSGGQGLPNDIDYTDQTQTIYTQKYFISNVGIGTTSPQAILQVASPAISLSSNSQPFGNGNVVVQATGGRSEGTGAALTFAMAANLDGSNTWEQGRIIATADTPGDADARGRLSLQTRYIDRNTNLWQWNNNLVLTSNGSVGVGTVSPGALLEVNGNVKLSSGSGASITFPDGTVQSTAWNGTTLGGDYAESVDVLGGRSAYEPGDLIVIDSSETGKFDKSSSPYSKLVAGVYSTKPGLVGRRTTAERPNKADEVPMAMMGIVPTKVCTENGPVERGDLLVSSSTPGYAMKGTDAARMMGAVIGKALAPLKAGSAIIEVLVSMQ